MIFFILLEKLLMLDMNVDRSFFFLSVVGLLVPVASVAVAVQVMVLPGSSLESIS